MRPAIIWLPAASFALMLRWTECANSTHLFHKSGPSGNMKETDRTDRTAIGQRTMAGGEGPANPSDMYAMVHSYCSSKDSDCHDAVLRWDTWPCSKSARILNSTYAGKRERKKEQRKKHNQILLWPQQHAVRTSLLAHKSAHRMLKMCHWHHTAGLLMLLLYVVGVGCQNTAMAAPVVRRQNIAQRDEESAQAGFDSVFGDSNATNRLADLSASGVAKVFANGIAAPIKAAIPRSYSYTSVKAQMQVPCTHFTSFPVLLHFA